MLARSLVKVNASERRQEEKKVVRTREEVDKVEGEARYQKTIKIEKRADGRKSHKLDVQVEGK